MSNAGLERAMERMGGRLLRCPVGDRYVVETLRTQGCNFGGEQSGHLVFLDHNTTGDGVLAALQLLAIMIKKKKALSELATLMTPLPQVLHNVRMAERIAPERIPNFPEALQEAQAQLGTSGRILVRPSGTEPLIRVMVEGEDEKQINDLALALCNVILQAERG